MNDFDKKYDEAAKKINRPTYWCEADGCGSKARIEYTLRDFDGDIFQTYRCGNHKKTDPNYETREV